MRFSTFQLLLFSPPPALSHPHIVCSPPLITPKKPQLFFLAGVHLMHWSRHPRYTVSRDVNFCVCFVYFFFDTEVSDFLLFLSNERLRIIL